MFLLRYATSFLPYVSKLKYGSPKQREVKEGGFKECVQRHTLVNYGDEPNNNKDNRIILVREDSATGAKEATVRETGE